MKFVDEAKVYVEAGKGGDGSASFRREKFIPFGGPDGGDGGDGGSIFFVADSNINTLINFRYTRGYQAKHGENGKGKQCTGKKGEDLYLKVPVGTTIYNDETDELLGDLTEEGETFCIAKGGHHGLGNVNFKSSVNRAPRKTTKGQLGEKYHLRLELKVLADVGLLGLPNAGKSTFISAVSHARPKVADYPFTTLYPQLGVVRVSDEHSFVVADIPGLIQGASEGAGLGIRFLKHLARTRLLLHLVDIAPVDESDVVAHITTILNELEAFDEALVNKARWLVFTKTDLLLPEEARLRCQEIVSRLNWKGPVYQVSSVSHQGLEELCYAIMEYLITSAQG